MELQESISGGVGIGAGLVLVGTFTGQVIALDQQTGSERWRAQVSSEILSAPQANDDVVVAQAVDGRLFGLDVEDGSQRWMYDNPLPLLTLRGSATPLLTADTVYAGFASGKLLAIQSRDGLLRWEKRIGLAKGRSELERIVDVDGSPLLVGDIIYVAGYQGSVTAISRGTGRSLWAKPASSHQSLASGAGLVFMVTADDRVVAYQSGSGEIAWENDQLLRRQLSAPQAFGGYLAVADAMGYLHLLSPQDGSFVGREHIDGDGISAPMVSDGQTLYILSKGGELTAVEIERD